MGTLKQTKYFIILITLITFSCNQNDQDRPKDVSISLEVKAKQLFNESNPDKKTIEKYCLLKDGLNSSGYGVSKKNFKTNIYNTKFVFWTSDLDPNSDQNGYTVEITHIVRTGTPIILNKNVITRKNGNGKLKAKVIKKEDENHYMIYFIIISPDGISKSYIIDPILKANPER